MSSSNSPISENRPVIISLVIVGLLLAGYMVYFFSQSDAKTDSSIESLEISIAEPSTNDDSELEKEESDLVTPTASTDAIEGADEVDAFVLPRLNSSDQLLRDGVVSLTRHEGINAWLSPDELIRKVVVFVDNVANGRVAKETVAVMSPRSGFKVRNLSSKVFVVDDYSRYDTVTNVLRSIDARRLAELYVLLKPLFKEAYGELGYPNANFDDTIFRAIGRLLETPVLSEPPRLIRPVVMYEYEEERLERLSAAQKQLLRMGPKNTQAIQNKLSEIAIELRSVLGR